jgi:hypothetical protein
MDASVGAIPGVLLSAQLSLCAPRGALRAALAVIARSTARGRGWTERPLVPAGEHR